MGYSKQASLPGGVQRSQQPPQQGQTAEHPFAFQIVLARLDSSSQFFESFRGVVSLSSSV